MNLQIIAQSSAESESTGRLLLSKLGAENNSEYSACGSTTTGELPCSVDHHHHHHHHQAMSEAATPLLPTATIPTVIMSNNLVSKTRNTHAQPRVGNQAKSMEPPAQEGSNNTPAHLEFDEGRKEIRAIVSKLSELGILRHSAGGLKATEAELANTQSSYYLLPPLPAHMAKLLCTKSTHKKTETQNSVVAVNHSSKEKHDALAPDNAMEKGVLSSQAAVADTARNEAPGAMLEPKPQLTEMLRHGEESQLSTSGDNLTAAANELGIKRAASQAADQAGERNLLQGQAGVMNENLQCTEDKSSKNLQDIIKPCSSNVMKEPTIASGPQYRKPPQEDPMRIDNQGEVTTQIIELVKEPDVKPDQEKREIVDDGSSCKPVGISAYIAEEGEIIEDGVLMKAAGETTILKHGLVSEDSVRRTSGGATIKNVSEDGSDTNPPRPLAAVGKDDTLITAAMLPPQIMTGKQHGDHQSSERAVMEHHKLILPHYPHHAGMETENRYTVKQLLLPQAAASGGYQPCEMFKHAQQQRSGVLQTLYDSHETMSHQAAAAAEELWRLHLYNQRRQQQFAPPLTSCNHQLPAAAASQPQSSSSSDAARCGNPKTNVGCDSSPEKEALVAADASRPTAAAGCTAENNNVVASEDSRPLLPDPAYATHAAAVAAVAHMPNLPEYWLQYQRRFLKTQQADVARDDGAAASHLQPHLASSDRSSDGVQSRKAENLADPSGRLPLLQWPPRLLPSNNKPLFSPRPHLQQHRASSQSSSSQQPWLQGGTHHRRGGTSSSSSRIPGGPHHFSNNTHGGQQPTSRGGQQVHRKPGVTRAPGGVTRPQFPRQLLLQEHHHHRGVLGYPTHLFHQALLQQMIALQAADAHQTTGAAVGCPRHWRRIKRDFTARGDSSSSSSAPPYQPQQVWQQQHGGQNRRSQSSTSVYTYRSQNSNNSGWDQTTAGHDHEEKEQRVAANSSYSSNESGQQQQQFEKDQQINQQPAAAAALQPIMQHHTLRFPPNMKWQRVPNDRNSLQTLVKTPGNIPDEETLQSKHIATACNCEHCRAKSMMSLEASPREVLAVS